MKLFNISIPNKDICSVDELYVRGNDYFIKDAKLHFKKDSTLSFDTYFNLFSHTKYNKFSRVEILEINLKIKGNIVFKLWQKHENCENELLSEKIFLCSDISEEIIKIDLADIKKEGFIFFSLTALNEESVFYGGFYSSEIDADPVKIGIVICTYKREEYVTKNLKNLEAYFAINSSEREKFGVFVIDNGKTLDKKSLPDFVQLFKNENLGGSGGFTRGIMEVYKQKNEYTHFLLMDDDISFDCETLSKTANILTILKNEYKNTSVGGGMLISDTPTIQYEFGGIWKKNKTIPNNHEMDVREVSTLIANEHFEKINYSAWWYMCMPIQTVEKVGLPLPLFIKFDDVEYGLRGIENLLLLNGIGVWHESFEKKFSGDLEYYVKRNGLIISSFNGKGFFNNYIKLVRAVSSQLVKQRYFVIDLIFKAYSDYLKGAEFLLNTDATALHQELRKECPVLLSMEEIKEKYGIVFDEDEYKKTLNKKNKYFGQVLTLNGYLLPKFMYRDLNFVDMGKNKAINFYKSKQLLQYNPYYKKGFVTQIKKKELFKTLNKLIAMFFIMIFKYPAAKKSYISNYQNLISFESWEKRLKLK